MMKSIRIAAALIALLVAIPGFAQRGTADFSHFVALGDSYGAGVSNGSLNDRHQQYSWPAIIARQAGAGVFAQSWVSYPGVGPATIVRDPFFSRPLAANRRWGALAQALNAEVEANQRLLR